MNQGVLVEQLRQVAGFLWMALVLVWVVSALRTKRTVQRQSSASQLLYTAILLVGVYLIFAKQTGVPWLDRQLVVVGVPIVLVGLVTVLTGVIFSVWARMMLGGNWSNSVTVKETTRLCGGAPIALSVTRFTAEYY